MNDVTELITENLDIWTSSVQKKNGVGRGSSKKLDLYGIKKLRELILELAVRGKLIPQNPNDEPASVLLERIAAEKTQLIKDKKIKKQKDLPEFSSEVIPFEPPRGWEWVQLGKLIYLEMGQSPASKYYNQSGDGLPFFQGKADFGSEYPTVRYWCTVPTKYAYPNDILLSVRAPVGPTNLSNIECCIGRGLAALRPLCKSPSRFISILMSAFRPTLESYATGTTFAAVSKDNIENLVVVVPPLNEQHRIVEKVDELMALCDQLEQQTEENIDAHQTLVETLLGTLTQSLDADELEQNWNRITDQFDILFTTEESINLLKQTILQLAVMGKLVSEANEVRSYKVSQLVSFGPRNGLSPREEKYETGYRVLKLGATTKGFLNIDESKSVDISVASDSHLWIQKDDILIQRGNSAEYVGCNLHIENDLPNYIYPDLMMKVRVNENILPRFFSLSLASPGSRKQMWDKMTGTSGTMPKISKKVVENVSIRVPDIQTQERIIQRVDQLNSICDKLNQKIINMSNIKIDICNSIIKRTFSENN